MKRKFQSLFTVALFTLLVLSRPAGAQTNLTWDPGSAQLGTEVYTNAGTAAGSYLFEVTTQADPLGLWRSVLKVDAGEAHVYTSQNIGVATNFYSYRSETPGSDTIVQGLTAGQTWYILVEAEAGAQWSLFAGAIHMVDMVWDPGTADAGTEVLAHPDTTGGAYYYKITTELPDLAAWRTALDVTASEADLYIRQNALPYKNSGGQSFDDSSTRTGDDGFTRYLSNTTGAGQEWYILVLADDGANWNLLSGDVYAQDLGALAADASSGSGVAEVPPEGIRYFKTTIPSAAFAWRLWLQNAAGAATLNQPFYVRQGLAPHPLSTSYYDRTRIGQGLLVPTYLEPGSPSFYYVGVPGDPGDSFQLDSRQHEIIDEAYNHTTPPQSQAGFLFKTYRIPVPPEQIAWEVTVEPVGGTNPDVAVRNGLVPNAFNNDAFSEVASASISDSITLVPETLSDGSFYVTVYGDSTFQFNLRNREPVITQIDFLSSTLNNDPLRAGWRFFAVSDIGQQLGQLGWLLELSNHVPGTEIAIRRNFVPGRWNYRRDGQTTIRQTAHNDLSSTLGFLQDPDHEADVWYVGIYSPAAALGAFTLDSGSHTPTVIPMDGHTNATVSLEPNSYHFYRVTVPAQTNGQDVVGWELRMTEWANERPYMLIRRDQLPEGTASTAYWYPWSRTEWLSGKQWSTRNNDWTGYRDDPGGQQHPQPIHSMGMGAPLEPGSYFIAFYNNSDTVTASYSFISSAIGTGMTYEPTTLGFVGAADVTNLPARAVEYFRVNIASNTPSWQVRLENTVGESQLYIREAFAPTWQMGSGDTTSPGQTFNAMTRLNKSGDELFTLLPENGEPFLPAGDYYLMVVSTGQTPGGSTVGTGTSSATLHSYGTAAVNTLGTLNPGGTRSDVAVYEAGETVLYQFDVAPNVPALEVRLESTTGTPTFYLRRDDALPRGPGYGIYSGHNSEFSDTHIQTFANPSTGTWSIVVGQAGNPAAGGYTLIVRAVDSTEFVFDGGGDTTVTLPPEEWRFYHVTVPAQTNGQDVIGWELRMTEWTNARPTMYIRRDLLPASSGVSAWYYAWSDDEWPSGKQWSTQASDWTGYSYDPGGQAHPQPVLSMAMGAPLEPGSYYIAFRNTSQSVTGTFSFVSSAIGTGMTYEPRTLPPFGNQDIIDLPAREVEYFRIAVPAGQPSWRFELENSSGESQLYIREARVPTWQMGSGPTTSPGLNFSSMTRLKIGDSEHFVLLPENGETTVPGGDYYLMVVSEGQSPSGSTIGTGTASAVLRSHGPDAFAVLGPLPNPGTFTHPDSYAKGRVKRYQFDVPAGVQSMQIRLEDRVGNPEMNLRLDTHFPNGTSYGLYSGHGREYTDTMILNFTEPAPGTWSLMVNDASSAASTAAGSYTLKIETSGTTPIVFDGGGASGAVLAPETWKYYRVEVPVQTNGQDVIGWELRVTDWAGSRPAMYIRRDDLPARSGVGGWYYAWNDTSWPSGKQWSTSGGDWSHRAYPPVGSVTHPKYLLSMGIDRPLTAPGTYYIGFYNSSTTITSTYTFVSSAIGNGMTYDPLPVGFNSATPINNLPAREVKYYEVEVLPGTANWKLRLENVSGETALYLREAHVPTWQMGQYSYTSPGENIGTMTRLDKVDDEYFILLPENGETTIPSGLYHLMVVSLGDGPTSSRVGTGTSSAILHSLGEQTVPSLGDVPYGGNRSATNTYAAGEADNLYRFNVTTNIGAVELRLVDVAAGNPRMHLRKDANLPNGPAYGLYSGYNDEHYDAAVITIPTPVPGTWSVGVADPDNSSALQGGEYTLRVTHKVPADLNFDELLNTNGNSNVDSGVLADNQRDFYRVEVPSMLGGEPVVGWYLTTSTTQGDAQTRVRRNALPQDGYGVNQNQTPFDSPAQVVAPPLLTPGIWYVEVKGVGATDYTLTSSAVWMEREWTMPAVGEPITTPGLPVPLFGDSGVNDAGNPLPIDQGVDLNNGFYHFYSVTVPVDNTGLLRTQLEAISGNPNLYIRVGLAPTLDYSYNYQTQYDHRLDSTANTEYGNWVPYDGRYERALEAGTWYIMVKADGGSNARYRLKLSGGNAYPLGNVQELALDGGSHSSQLLAAGDFRHYRVVVPTNAPVNWNITYSQESGNVDLFLRDTVPPGNSWVVSDSYIRDWDADQKNRGTPRPDYPNTGTHVVNMPPLRPGHVYYLGFLARTDASFTLGSAVSGGTIPLYEKVDFETGFVSTNVPAFSEITYQVDVPPDAVRWIHSTTNTSAINVYLEQGTLPSKTTSDHYYRTTGSHSLNKFLLRVNDQWPWRPNYTYFFTVVNPTAAPEPFILVMGGSTTPEIPQTIHATDGTRDDDVYVNWASVNGAGYYELWRNTVDDPATATHLQSNYGSTGYYDTTAVPGQLYYYWASVASQTNIAWFSDSDSGWRPGFGVIAPSQRVHSFTGGVGTITVTAPAGTYWKATESLGWVTIDSGALGTNSGSVAYTVKEYAGDTARTGTITVARQTFLVIQEPFGVPANVQATDGAFADRTEITWDELPGSTRYYLYRNEVNNTVGADYIGFVTTNLFSDIGGTTNRTYFYWVRPYNSDGLGGYSLPDKGYRGFGGVPQWWIDEFFPGGYPGDLRIESWNDSPAGFVIHWTSREGCVYSVLWTERLADPFTTLASGIVFPQGSYTDTVHTVEDTGFYRLQATCSGGYPGDLIDSDGDRFNNYEEYIAGSDPTNHLSFLRITRQTPVPGGLEIEWLPSVTGRWYTVLWTDALTNAFQTLQTGIDAPQNTHADPLHGADDTGYYRVEVELK